MYMAQKKQQINRKKDFLVIKQSGMTEEQASEVAKFIGLPAIYVHNWQDVTSRDIAYIEEMLKAAKRNKTLIP